VGLLHHHSCITANPARSPTPTGSCASSLRTGRVIFSFVLPESVNSPDKMRSDKSSAFLGSSLSTEPLPTDAMTFKLGLDTWYGEPGARAMLRVRVLQGAWWPPIRDWLANIV
jgi:hypothetical protein